MRLVVLLVVVSLVACKKPFDVKEAELAIDRVSLMECQRRAGESGDAVVVVTFESSSGRATNVEVEPPPAEPNRTLPSLPLKEETAACIAERLREEARVPAFSTGASVVRRKVTIVRMEDWHRP
jgi:hypothetical protein